MKLTGMAYEVSAEVEFTKAEVALLIKHAKAHYDHACWAAGLTIGERGARENGFIAQLKMRAPRRIKGEPYARAVWKFRQLDTALKILEMHGNDPKVRVLSSMLWGACKALEIRYTELTKEEASKKCQKDR
jgi:hypothetical protein